MLPAGLVLTGGASLLPGVRKLANKVTGLPASRFGLHDRGAIRAGAAADQVLFDPATVRDVADFHDPVQPAAGIHAVWVNGRRAYDGQAVATGRHGRFLAPR